MKYQIAIYKDRYDTEIDEFMGYAHNLNGELIRLSDLRMARYTRRMLQVAYPDNGFVVHECKDGVRVKEVPNPKYGIRCGDANGNSEYWYSFAFPTMDVVWLTSDESEAQRQCDELNATYSEARFRVAELTKGMENG